MVNLCHGFLLLLLLQLYVGAAPSYITDLEGPIRKTEEISDVFLEKSSQSTNLEEPAKDAPLEDSIEVNPEQPKIDPKPLLIDESRLDDPSSSSNQGQRQKRFYNFFGYGAPPINPIVYPGYNKRDQSADVGVYGIEDPLEQIHRRLHDIASFVRQPAPAPPPPPQSHFPFFFPVIYIPQYGCDCNSGGANTPPENPQTKPPNPATNQTDPEPDKRFPDLSDDRLNWGFVSNDNDTEYDEDEFARPISFEPLQPARPIMRPAPPVEHGSSQGDSAAPQSTTVRPPNPSRPSNAPGSFAPAQPGRAPYPPSFSNDIPRKEQPSACDGAVLSCCHQPYLSYDCFANQGCPDLRSYGSPCDPQQILRVIDKFQKFYGVRNGN